MRQVFDQYSQNENRASHALATALARDTDFCAAFVKLALPDVRPPHNLKVECQSVPGSSVPTEAEAERLGLPDIWIHDGGDWCLLIEAKVTAPVSERQLETHRSRARRQGFTTIYVKTLTARNNTDAGLLWRDVHQLAKSCRWATIWPALTAEFLEVLEVRMVHDVTIGDANLTGFSGIEFGDDGYGWGQAARLLRQIMNELRREPALVAMGVDPDLPGRGAITGRGTMQVWDYLRLAGSADKDHTHWPHLTVNITHDAAAAKITLPNSLERVLRKRMTALGSVGWRQLANDLVNCATPLVSAFPAAVPMCRMIQRRYPSQRATPYIDCLLEFDLRTCAGGPPVKLQPQWLDAAFRSWSDRQSNLQLQFGVQFPLDRCPEMKTPAAIHMLRDALLATKPVLQALGLEHSKQDA
ncbi:hypothetical protein [Sandarakinorhabdus sp.]|uniref:hypothetical protein n=1 Tax=Sandarakinorhabdus sp. TaxID=1916663 RepID=UPI00333EDD1A